jgi:hypothetical protein
MQPDYGAPAPQPPQPAQSNYDFITNPQQYKPKRSLPTGGSKLSRILVVAVGLIILIIAFTVIKGLVSGGGNKAALLHVAQNQQELIHLSTAAAQLQTISADNKNFALTTQLVLTSQKGQLLAYLKQQKQKIDVKQLNLKVSATLDTQLANAAASSTYDATFADVMKSQLIAYQSALKVAYSQTAGANGRKLLNEDYTSARLLLQQLSPASQ